MMREQFENFANIVCEQTANGFRRGMDVFLSELNDEMTKDNILKECSFDGVIDHLVDQYVSKSNIDLSSKK